ncbi:synaptonemal complex protein 3-like [Amphiura filiformis]|uniref:synaptonemal complex protein 3-like n=1 Tax=Amphiura filiformis TaxID=82378 RepID=UPI003B21E984
MPRAPSSKKATSAGTKDRHDRASKKAAQLDQYQFDDDDINEDDLEDVRDDEALSASTSTKGSKRKYLEEEDEETTPAGAAGGHLDGEMQTMLESFGADMRKSLSSKRKRLENFTQQSLKSANTKVDKIWKMQQSERKKLQEEYNKQLSTVLDQWETDVNKIKDQEEKLQNVFKQHQKLFQQTRITMAQRLKMIKQLFDQFSKTMGDLEQCHQDQQGLVQGELRKEMAMLQKKILMDTQHQEMANVRKSLQTMFF